MRIPSIALVAALLATPAVAQVEVQPLAAPDYFSLGLSDTGLPQDLWRGTSPDIAKAVIPKLAAKPLTPAAARLARQVLSTGAMGPGDAGRDAALAAARADALLDLGRPRAAWATLDRAQGLSDSPALSQAAAEAALFNGQDDAACRVAEQLVTGRGEPYWLRLRAYCQARAGQADAAELTLTLAGDATTSRLVHAVLAGQGGGDASLRDGIDYALSKRLGLDLAAVTKGVSPAAKAAVESPDGDQADAPIEGSRLAARLAAQQGREAEIDALFVQASAAEAKARGRYQAALVIAAALGAPFTEAQRAQFAAFDVPAGSIAANRFAALDIAAGAGLKGETALLALDIATDGGAKLKAADAARLVAALNRAGLTDAAIAFADEALTTLQVQ